MGTVAYGSLTIVDLTDIGEFSVYPMSNLPLSVIYDPDQNSYSPNWGTENLVLTPKVYYAGKAVSLDSSYLSCSWQKQNGTSAAVALGTGEKVSGNVLTVSATEFNANVSMVTYIVTATYNEPTLNQTLTAEGQITFTLVRHASKVKTASITGSNVFTYDASKKIKGADSIILTGTVKGVTISAWQYKSGDSWLTYPNSTAATTLTVNASDNVFTDDVATIRLATNDSSVYDLFSITKIYDGANGSSTVSAVLTNDAQFIPADSNGNVSSGAFAGATSQIIIYEGGTDVTSKWTISTEASTGVTYTSSTVTQTGDKVVVTGMSGQTGNIVFTATRSGYNAITKTFSLVKIEEGADGETPTVYEVNADSLVINRKYGDDNTYTFSPSTFTVTAYSTTGNANKTAYSGRFKISGVSGGKSTAVYSSTSDESNHTITATNYEYYVVELYKAGAFTTKLDEQTISVVSDGKQGEQGIKGDTGEAALNVILGNEAEVIPVRHDNTTNGQYTITIPFGVYKGTTRLGTSGVTYGNMAGLPTVTRKATNATTSADGTITLTFNGAVSVANGTIALTFNIVDGSTTRQVVKYFSWTRSTASSDGENAVLMQVYAPEGDFFSNGGGTLKLATVVYDGSTDVTDKATSIQWAKYINGSYQTLSTDVAGSYTGTGTKTLTVYGSFVDSYASFRCIVHYDGADYTQYYSLQDKTDPLQVSVHCSIGNQIVNNQGVGALYVRVSQNGKEIDPLKTMIFDTNAPSDSSLYYYKLDQTNHDVSLMHRTSTASNWTSQSETYEAEYTWSWRDKDGNPITEVNDNTLPTSGKVIYIDGDLVNEKITADVQVKYPK